MRNPPVRSPTGPRGASAGDVSRRRFLQLAAGSAAATSLSAGIARAAGIPPAVGTGTLADVEHIVVLMQENRSFDHYFGTLRGVRGFGDPRPLVLPSGRTVSGWGVAAGNHWYDVRVTSSGDPAFVRRFAGHVETGAASTSDPAIATV